MTTFDDNVLRPPFVIFGGCLEEFDAVVEAAGFDRVFVTHIDLRFVSLSRPAFFLEFGVEEDTGVAARGGFDVCFEFKVLEGSMPKISLTMFLMKGILEAPPISSRL